MVIEQPQLPPMRGYVEIEQDGERVYRNVNTGAIYRPEELMAAEQPLNNEEITEILKAMSGEESVSMQNTIKYQRGGRLVSKLMSFINIPRAFPEWGWAV